MMKVVTFDFRVRVQVPDTGDEVADALTAVHEVSRHLGGSHAHDVLRSGGVGDASAADAVREFTVSDLEHTEVEVAVRVGDVDERPPLATTVRPPVRRPVAIPVIR